MVVDLCRVAGARRLGLTVALDNVRAIAAYRAVGFVTSSEDASAAQMWLALTAE